MDATPSIQEPSPASIQALEDFLSIVDVPRFSKELRNLFLEYLIDNHEELHADFEHLAEDLKFLFDFLDRLEKDQRLES